LENDHRRLAAYDKVNKSVQIPFTYQTIKNETIESSNANNNLSHLIPNLNFIKLIKNENNYDNYYDNNNNNNNNNNKNNMNTDNNSKRIIYSTRKNETENSLNEDVLNSNDFRISNSNLLLMQQSKNFLKSSDGNSNKHKTNEINLSADENENNDFDNLIVKTEQTNLNHNFDNFIDMHNFNLATENSQNNNNFPLKINKDKEIIKCVKDITKNNTNNKNAYGSYRKKNNKKISETKNHFMIGSEKNKNKNKPACYISPANNLNYENKNDSSFNFYNDFEKQVVQADENSYNTFIIHNTNSYEEKLKRDLSQKNKSSKNFFYLGSNFGKSSLNIINKNRDSKKIREIKEEENLFGQIEELKKEKIKQGEIFKKRFVQDIDKVKTDKLKEIYEIVERNIMNINSLSKFGVSSYVIEQLIFPVISIIHKRNMEFNFHNFQALAKEFINRVF